MSDGEWLTASWGKACKMIGSQVLTASSCSALRETLASVVSKEQATTIPGRGDAQGWDRRREDGVEEQNKK
jgi:hypothetical protein